MDTRLVNSQLVSRKDVRVWFWDGQQEYKGDVVMMAENGILFHVKIRRPSESTIPDSSALVFGVKKALEGKKVMVELSSPRTAKEVKMRFDKVTVTSAKKDVIAVTATLETALDPNWVKMLLEPSVTRIPKKDEPRRP